MSPNNCDNYGRFLTTTDSVTNGCQRSVDTNANSPPVNETVETRIEDVMRRVFQQEVAAIKKQITDMREKIDNVADIVERLNTKASIEETELQPEVQVTNFEFSNENATDSNVNTKYLENMDVYSRRNNVIIQGVPHLPRESTDEIVLTIAAQVGMSLNAGDIDTSHRLPSTNIDCKRPPNILVKFVRRKHKTIFVRECREKKLDSRVLGFKENRKIFVNEHLPKHRVDLLQKALLLKTRYCFKYIWTRDGKILVRKGDGMEALRIDTVADIEAAKALYAGNK